MSRFMLVCSLVFGLSSSALAAEGNFAKPPVATDRAMEAPAASLRIAPQKIVSRAQVRAALVKARAQNLARFRAYQKKGVFPSTTYAPGKLNVWIDEDGNLCAAATIINASGRSALVQQVGEQNNFIRLADVKQGALMDWILMSGLTQDEIVAIQEPFVRVSPEPEPQQPILVDAKLRAQEDARLRATSRAVDKQIVKNAKGSLDRATDKLMKRQDLARKLVASMS